MTKYERLSFPLAMVVLLIIAGTYVVNAMDRMVFAVLLPSVGKEYGFSLVAGGFLATVFTLGLGVAGIPGGYLFDKLSRKTIAVIGIVVYSVCTILTCFSVGFYDMAGYRAVSGIGEALQNAAIFTMAGAYFASNRTLAFGLLNAAYGVGSFVGPRWGTHLMTGTDSWRSPLYVYGALGLVGAVLTMLFVSKRFSEQQAERTTVNAAAEAHIPDRLINRNTLLVALASIGGGLAAFGYLGLYPTYLRTQLGFSPEATGAAASMYGAGALMGLVCGYMADRLSQKWLAVVTLVALAATGYSLFNVATTPFWQEVLSFCEGAFYSGFLYVNCYSLMQRSVRSAITGRASGLVVSCVYLAAALSGYLFAQLVGKVGWGDAALIQMALLLILPVIGMLFFDSARTSCPIRPSLPSATVASQPAAQT